jgi:hypothetical protein
MSYDRWGNGLEYERERDEVAERLTNLSDAELVELFGARPTVELSDIPPEALAAPTLGAIRRAQGIAEDPAHPFAHMCEEARVAFAWELGQEAKRRIVLERLDSIMQYLAVGATPDQAMTRLERLMAECSRVAA